MNRDDLQRAYRRAECHRCSVELIVNPENVQRLFPHLYTSKRRLLNPCVIISIIFISFSEQSFVEKTGFLKQKSDLGYTVS